VQELHEACLVSTCWSQEYRGRLSCASLFGVLASGRRAHPDPVRSVRRTLRIPRHRTRLRSSITSFPPSPAELCASNSDRSARSDRSASPSIGADVRSTGWIRAAQRRSVVSEEAVPWIGRADTLPVNLSPDQQIHVVHLMVRADTGTKNAGYRGSWLAPLVGRIPNHLHCPVAGGARGVGGAAGVG
jgi:hypothetical protein